MKKLTAEKCAWLVRQLKSAEVMSGELSIADQYKLQALEIALPILEQQERGEGEWIEWGGGDQPLDDYEMVEVRFRNGSIEAGEFAHCYEWNHGYHDLSTTSVDIIAYRIIPERATTQNGEQ